MCEEQEKEGCLGGRREEEGQATTFPQNESKIKEQKAEKRSDLGSECTLLPAPSPLPWVYTPPL